MKGLKGEGWGSLYIDSDLYGIIIIPSFLIMFIHVHVHGQGSRIGLWKVNKAEKGLKDVKDRKDRPVKEEYG